MPSQVFYRQKNQVHLLALSLLLLISILSFGQQDTASNNDDRLVDLSSQAQEAQQQGDYQTAAKCYEEIVKLRPDVPEAWANLGLMRQFLKEYPEANHAFQAALGRNPRLYVPNLFLGLNQLGQQQPHIALRYFKVAEEVNPADEQAALGLAHTYQALQDDVETARWFSRAAEIKTDDPDAWYGSAMAYLSLQDAAVLQLGKLGPDQVQARSLVADAFVAQGRAGDAINIYKKFLDAPDHPPCMLASLGFAYIAEGAELATPTFQEALKKEPACLAARLGLAHMALQQEAAEEFLSQMTAIWNQDKNFLRANVHLALRGIRTDDLGKEEAWLQQNITSGDKLGELLAQSLEAGEGGASAWIPDSAIETQDTAPDLWAKGHYTACALKLEREKGQQPVGRILLLAQCAYFSGDSKTSLAASDAALKREPTNLNALYWKAKSSQQLATSALEKMNAAAPGSAKVHFLMGELHRVREEYTAAETEYEQVLQQQPGDIGAQLGLAQVYLRQSQDDKVQREVQNILETAPENPEASFLMAQILVKRHQFGDAHSYLDAALKGSPHTWPQVHSLRARCFAAEGNFAAARDELKAALPSDKDGAYHYQLYQIYQKMGDAQAAAQALQESNKLRRQSATPAGKN